MRVCIANPPAYLYDDSRHFIQSGSRWSFSMDAPKSGHKKPHYQPFPFSLAYASSILQERGDQVFAFDACALDMDEQGFIDTVNKHDIDVLYIDVPIISSAPVLKMLSEIDKSLKIILTGAITALPYLPYETIPGQWDTKLWGKYSKFKDFQFPDRVQFPNDLYSNFETARPTAQMITSRGCPHNCIFCLERHVTYESHVVEFRTPENVVEEMVQLHDQGVKHIYFDDMSITSKKEHIEGICSDIMTRKLKIDWTCMGDLLVSENTLRKMAHAGCQGLAFGVETLTEQALKQTSKTFVNKRKVVSFINLLEEYEIWSHATYAIGLPGETKESIRDTIDFAFSAGSDSLQFSIATPYPGTPFYKMCKDNGWLVTEDFTRYDGARYGVVDYPNLKREEIEELFRYAMNKREELGLKFRK